MNYVDKEVISPKLSSVKFKKFRGSCNEFAMRNKINRKALAELRFYLAKKIYKCAIDEGEKAAENGMQLIPLIRAYMKENIGYDISDRQARTYAQILATKTTCIEIYRHSGRGREWRIRLLRVSQKWILKMRNDRIRAQEELHNAKKMAEKIWLECRNIKANEDTTKRDIEYIKNLYTLVGASRRQASSAFPPL